jgi:hypothetical protein
LQSNVYAVSGEPEKYKLDLVGVQKVRLDKSGTEPADNYTFFYRNGNADHSFRTGFFIHKGIISAVTREDRMSHIIILSL